MSKSPPDYHKLRNQLAKSFHDHNLDHTTYHFLQLLVEQIYRVDEESADAADSALADMFGNMYSDVDEEALQRESERMSEEGDKIIDEPNLFNSSMHQDESPTDFSRYYDRNKISGPQAVHCPARTETASGDESVSKKNNRRGLRRVPH